MASYTSLLNSFRGRTMGWSFRRSKSFGLFKLNFSKSGVGLSFGVPGARVGVNAKGKKYLRGGIPGTGLYYQLSLAQSDDEAPTTDTERDVDGEAHADNFLASTASRVMYKVALSC